jgi:ABC-2 type transport system ATP-binding protein
VKAVDGLDLSVPDGGVFGFLGPNGSGKTTTIRCLLGLVRPSAGVCRVLGADSQRALPTVITRIGSMVETPGLFPGLTARDNLALLGRLDGIGAAVVEQTLSRVGLSERADDTIGGFSLGMRQRLGLAIALLKDPALLVLDEPANGLDPAGIKEVRDLVLSLGREGRTVFVSSHLLSEVQLTCDNVAILSHGRCVASGSVHAVLAGTGGQGLLVRVSHAEVPAAVAALQRAGFRSSLVGDGSARTGMGLSGDQTWSVGGDSRGGDSTGREHRDGPRGNQIRVETTRAATVTKVLADQGLYLTELRPDEADLETVFLQLTEPSPT